jgi:imidazolonepropionase-like amidohydrolase
MSPGTARARASDSGWDAICSITLSTPLQGGELALRGEVNRPIDVLRSATSVNAALLQREAELGCIAPNAYADILVVNGNPFRNLGLFAEPEANIPLVMKGGICIRNAL